MSDTLRNRRDMAHAAAFAVAHPCVGRLLRDVLEGPGVTSPGPRQAAALGGETPPEMRGYLDKVVHHAYRVTDEDIDALRAAGRSEDEILEVSIAAALGAALTRLERGLAAVRGCDETTKGGR